METPAKSGRWVYATKAPAPGRDDDHVLALFRVDGLWGAVAKSNFVNLRYREPVYRNLRELAMSYFEHYYNLQRQKTLRAYTRPLNLAFFKDTDWMWDEGGVKVVSRRLYSLKPVPLISDEGAARLSLADERSYKGGTYGTDFDWVYGWPGDEERGGSGNPHQERPVGVKAVDKTL